MKKKILALMLAGVMVFGLAACGGGEETTEPAEEEVAEEVLEEEVVEEEVVDPLDVLTIGLAGIGDDGNYYYMATDDEVNFAVMVILSADGTQSLNAVGEVVEDGEYLTIVDETSEYVMTFKVESIEGGVLLTMQDGTVVTMGSADVAEIWDIIVAIDEGTEIVNPLAE